jgi:hypothetical protein
MEQARTSPRFTEHHDVAWLNGLVEIQVEVFGTILVG